MIRKPQTIANIFICSLFLGALAFQYGCGKSEEQKPQEAAAPADVQPKKPVKTEVAAPVEEKTEEKVRGDKRNPFRSYIASIKPTEKSGRPIEELPPLERYDVSLFKIKAIVSGIKNSMAQVVAPDGKTHNIKKGTKIGIKGGIVVDVTKHGVVVEEITRDAAGKEISREKVEINLPAADKGTQGR